MSTTHKSKSVKCPFYHTDDPRKIVCEGLLGNLTDNHIFSDKKGKADYINRICCRNYKNCRHYLALMLSEYGDDNIDVDISNFNKLRGTGK